MGKIRIKINPVGEMTFDGVKFSGRECDTKMKPFEKAVGGVDERQDKPEINEADISAMTQQEEDHNYE